MNHLFSLLRNQRGLTLIEVMVAAAMLAAIIVSVAEFNDVFETKSSSLQRACSAHAQMIVTAVQEETYYRQVINWIPAEAARAANAFPGVGTRAVPAPPSWWTGAAGDFDVSGPSVLPVGVRLHSFQLIQGSMRSLASIYNNVPAVRCARGTYAPLTGLPVTADLARAGVNAVSEIMVRPYSLSTGAAICPGANLYPAPVDFRPTDPLWSVFAPLSGNQPIPPTRELFAPAPNPQPPAIAGTQIADRGVGNADMGIELTAYVNYTHEGRQYACNYTQKFEYPADRTAPAAPDVITVTANTTVPVNNCVPNPVPRATIQIGYSALIPDVERGFQFLCRDLSWTKNWPANPGPVYANPPCIRGGVIDPAVMAFPDDPSLQSFNRQNSWVPCDRLTQCGNLPNPAPPAVYNQANPNTLPNNHLLTLNYNLVTGCMMNFEVVAVDTAGNLSIAGQPANRRFLQAAGGPSGLNELRHSTCGVLCGVGSNFAGTYFTNGYYTCRIAGAGPCCVGAGCTPYN